MDNKGSSEKSVKCTYDAKTFAKLCIGSKEEIERYIKDHPKDSYDDKDFDNVRNMGLPGTDSIIPHVYIEDESFYNTVAKWEDMEEN
jgi:hypothetical protein